MKKNKAYSYSTIKRVISVVLILVMVVTICQFERKAAEAYTSTGDWGFDLYYLNEADTHVTHKTDSFSLKYAFKFDTTVGIDAFDVHVKINAELFDLRPDEKGIIRSVLPKQIGVPEGGYSNGIYKEVESLKSSFNYYYTTENEVDPESGETKEVKYLNFYNYKPLPAGYQNIVEVMYDGIDIFDVYDNQTWQIDATVSVDKDVQKKEEYPVLDEDGNPILDEEGNPVVEEIESTVVETTTISSNANDFRPLTGDVDSSVSLTSISKIAFRDSTVSYTPGLYTRSQVERYIGALPNDSIYVNADGTLNTADYIYMVWQSKVTGTCTQPWTLYIDDLASENYGSVLGLAAEVPGKIIPGTKEELYVVPKDDGTFMYYTEDGPDRIPRTVYYASGTDFSNKNYKNYNVNKMRQFTLNYYIVTVYDKKTLPGYMEGDKYELVNDIAAVLQSADDRTALQYKDSADLVNDGNQYEASDIKGVYDAYRWNYKNDDVSLSKSSKTKLDLYAWFDANAVTKDELGRWGRFDYEVNSEIRSYATTHTGVYNGAYLTYTGGYAVTEVSDDLIYVKDHGKLDDGTYSDGIKTGTYDGTAKTSDWSVLTPEDYYYSDVTITLRDIGYDPFEEKIDLNLLSDETVASVDANYKNGNQPWTRDWFIFVCDNPDSPYQWRLLQSVTWEEYLANKNGQNDYVLKLDEATLQSAFRVKVVHKSVDYNSSVKMNLTVTIKDTSPCFNAMYNESISEYPNTNKAKYDENSSYSAIIENEASLASARKGMTAGIYYNETDKQYSVSTEDLTQKGYTCIAANNQSISKRIKSAQPGKYSVDSVGYKRTNRAELTNSETEKLYQDSEAVMNNEKAAEEVLRTYSDNNILPQQKHANSVKTSYSVSNSTTGRINITYTLAAYEGYKVYSDVAKNNLAATGVGINRKVVEFYDLLPYKVSYDGSIAPTIGRLETTSDNYIADANRNWDDSQLTLTNTEITENYRGTGRTLVKFEITYNGEDATKFDAGNFLWYAGYGIQFSTYVDWTDFEDSKIQTNICAYMPGGNEANMSIIGTASETSMDDGISHPAKLNNVWNTEYCYYDTDLERFVPYLGPDINGDGMLGTPNDEQGIAMVRNVLYASSPATGQFATAAALGIVKTVKADNDETLPYSSTANVGFGDTYTYDVTLTNTENKLSNIVVFDRIENSIARMESDGIDRAQLKFDVYNDSWCGEIEDIDILSLINNKKILVKVYYSEERNVDYPLPVTTNYSSGVDSDILENKSLPTVSDSWKELIVYKILAVDSEGNEVDPSDAAFTDDGQYKYVIKCVKNLLRGVGGETISPSQIKAIAVDARNSYRVDENEKIYEVPFELGKGESLNFRYKMRAPKKTMDSDGHSIYENGYSIHVDSNGANADYSQPYSEDVVYAYNTPYYYSCLNNKYSLLVGNTTAVKLGDTEELVIKKRIDPTQLDYLNANSKLAGTTFFFKILNDEGQSCMDKKYQTWEYVGLDGQYDVTDEDWVYNPNTETYKSKKSGEIVDKDGYVLLDSGAYKTVPQSSTIMLKHNQKAVFKDVRNASAYKITEKESLLWGVEDKEDYLDAEASIYLHEITNTYQPILYLNKTLSGVPSSVVDPKKIPFTFRVEDSNGPVVGARYYFVKSANLTSAPVVITEKDDLGQEHYIGGVTDENGEFSFTAGQIVALLLPGQLGSDVRITEVLGDDSEWVCTASNNTISVSVEADAKKVIFENVYKYKDLVINKSVSHDELITPEDLSEYSFSFKIARIGDSGENVYLSYDELKSLYDLGKIKAVDACGHSIPMKEIVIEEDTASKNTKDGSTEGIVTARVGNGSITLSGIPGFSVSDTGKITGYSYYVKELTDADHMSADFKADAVDAIVSYLPKSSKAIAEISNDYLRRNLSVTKQLATSKENLTKDANKLFTLYLKDSQKNPLGGVAFTSDDPKRTVLVTAADGSFTIKPFEVITFKTIGRENETFYIAEKIDSDYIPLSLAFTEGNAVSDDRAFALQTYGEATYDYKVLNGGKEYLVIRKNYVGLDEEAEKHLEELLQDSGFHGLDISATLSIQCPDGSYVPYETYTIQANDFIVVNLKEIVDAVYTEKGYSLPGDYSTIGYKVEEQKVMPKLPDGTNADGEDVTYTVLMENGTATGKVMQDQVATLVNDVDSMVHHSRIWKHNYLVKPVQGAQMTWYLQEYSGSKWVAKDGVRYQIYDGTNVARSEVLTTDKSGKITITYVAGDDFSAYVAFEAENVYVNNPDPQPGDLRVIETDMDLDGWGYQIGVGTYSKFENELVGIEAGEMCYDQMGDIIINSREYAELEIEKQVVGQIVDDTAFEFTISTRNEDVVTYAAGLDYVVYNSADDSRIKSGVTSTNGTLLLTEGQYARVRVPKYIDWTIEENKTLHWNLNSVTNNKDHVSDDVEFTEYVTGNNVSIGEMPTTIQNFKYTGDYQVFVAPQDGSYFFQAWGAQGGAGGQNLASRQGGKGAYTEGYINLKKGDVIYVYVGGKGADGELGENYAAGGYNGGGKGSWGYARGEKTGDSNGGGGGGATDFRLVSGNWNNAESLASRIMVAGAGSGGRSWTNGGANASNFAGTFVGSGERDKKADAASGGTQTEGGHFAGVENTGHGGKTDGRGTSGGFGYGGDSCIYHGSGAGSGYYGGGGGGWKSGDVYAGGGGSSYVNGLEGCDKTYYNSSYAFDEGKMLAGNVSMLQPDGSYSEGHEGDGYARISFVGKPRVNGIFEYTGEIQEYKVPKSGFYQLEAWGAQGGSFNSENCVGGKGAYTSGVVYLVEGQKIYVAVGQQPDNYTDEIAVGEVRPGGWNGGGSVAHANAQNNGACGGGATDFRLIADENNLKKWDDQASLQSRIMVAAGGGGGVGLAFGGSGGALEGIRGCSGSTNYEGYYSLGGTQKAGGTGVNESSAQGVFGKGGSVPYGRSFGGNGGGGGYYGGGSTPRPHGGAGGGSSYINGFSGCDTSNYNKDYVFIDAQMIAGVKYQVLASTKHPVEEEFAMPQPDGSINNGHEGNGFARITYLGDLYSKLPDGGDVSLVFANKKNNQNVVAFAKVTGRTLDNDYNYSVDMTDFIVSKELNTDGGLYLVGTADKALNYETNKVVDMVSGDVEIPEYIVTCDQNGKCYKNKVVAIYAAAYGWNAYNPYYGKKSANSSEGNQVITSLTMPDSIECLGFSALNTSAANFSYAYVSKGLKYYGYCAIAPSNTNYTNGNRTLIMNGSADGISFQKCTWNDSGDPYGPFGRISNDRWDTLVIGEGFEKISGGYNSQLSYNDKVFYSEWINTSVKTIIYGDSITEIGGRALTSRANLECFLPMIYTDSIYTYKDGRVIGSSEQEYIFYDETKKTVNFADIDQFRGSCIFSGKLKTIGSYAFQQCKKLDKDLVVDCSVEKLNAEIFSGTQFKGTLRISHGFNQIQNGNGGTSVLYDSSNKVMTFCSTFGGMSVINCNTFSAIDFDFRNIDTDVQHTACTHCGETLPRMDIEQAEIFKDWTNLKYVNFGSAIRNIGTQTSNSNANGTERTPTVSGPFCNDKDGSDSTADERMVRVIFSEGVEVIGDFSFMDNQTLGDNQKISLPSTLIAVGRGAFRNARGCTGIDIRGAETGDSNLQIIDCFAFQHMDKLGGTFIIPANCTDINSAMTYQGACFDKVVFLTDSQEDVIQGKQRNNYPTLAIFNNSGNITIYVNENATNLYSTSGGTISLKQITGTSIRNGTSYVNLKMFSDVGKVTVITYKTGEKPWE